MEEKSNLKNPAFCCFETPWRILAFALKCPCPVKHVVQKATYSAMTIPEQSIKSTRVRGGRTFSSKKQQ